MGHSSSNHKKKIHCFPAPSPHRPAKVNTNGDGETAIDLAYRYPQLAPAAPRGRLRMDRQRAAGCHGCHGEQRRGLTVAEEKGPGELLQGCEKRRIYNDLEIWSSGFMIIWYDWEYVWWLWLVMIALIDDLWPMLEFWWRPHLDPTGMMVDVWGIIPGRIVQLYF